MVQIIWQILALENHYQSDVRDAYKVVKAASAGSTAQITGGAETTNHGIVSCNKGLGIYIAMELFSVELSDDRNLR